MFIYAYEKSSDQKPVEVVDGLLPFTIKELQEAKDLADVIEKVYKYRPTLESIVYENRIARQEAKRKSEELQRNSVHSKREGRKGLR